jgi:hypothetical protein
MIIIGDEHAAQIVYLKSPGRAFEYILSASGTIVLSPGARTDTGEDYKNISTELRNLESIGLLGSSRSGNLKYFRLNQGFLLYSELKSVFFKIKGAPGLLKQVLSGSKDIEYAFIYGSFASGNENEISDIDLMAIGKMPLENLLKLLRTGEVPGSGHQSLPFPDIGNQTTDQRS